MLLHRAPQIFIARHRLRPRESAGPDRVIPLTNLSPGRRIGPEALLRNRPDLLVVPVAPAFPSLATAMLRNGPIARLPQRAVPPALTICAGPFTANAVAILAQ